jgi:hypothetical protein
VEELDRVIDETEKGPLSEEDRRKLRTALHALIDRLRPHAKTEKTSSVFREEPNATAGTVATEVPSSGHGRNGANAYRSAEKVSVAHQKLTHGDRCPDCARGNVYAQKEPKALVRIVGQAPLAATVYDRNDCAAMPADRCSRLRRPRAWGRRSMTKRPRL